MNKLPFLTLVVLTVGAALSESRSQSDEKQPDVPLTVAEQKSELAKLREIFASVDKVPAKGARWVEVQAGSAEQKTWHKGWLLRESEAEIQLLTEHGRKETFDKKKLAAKKPPTEFKWSDAWAVRNADFAKHCRDFMAEKKKKSRTILMRSESIASSANGRKRMPPSLTRPVWPPGQAQLATRNLPDNS